MSRINTQQPPFFLLSSVLSVTEGNGRTDRRRQVSSEIPCGITFINATERWLVDFPDCGGIMDDVGIGSEERSSRTIEGLAAGRSFSFESWFIAQQGAQEVERRHDTGSCQYVDA